MGPGSGRRAGASPRLQPQESYGVVTVGPWAGEGWSGSRRVRSQHLTGGVC